MTEFNSAEEPDLLQEFLHQTMIKHSGSEKPDLLQEFLDFMDNKQECYTARFAAHFGHLDQDTLMRVMFNTRLAMIHGDESGLRQVLSDTMIIVPGENQISQDQLDILSGTYAFNREHWDETLNKWIKGGGLEHGS